MRTETDMSQEKQSQTIPYDILTTLSLLTGFLIAFQYITLSKLIVIQQNTRFEVFEFFKVVQQIISWTATDLLLGGGIFITILILIVLEISRNRFSIFLTFIFETHQRTLITLIVSSAVFTRFYIAPGAFGWQTDMASHISYCYLASDAIQRGEFPVWTNLLGTGSPFMQFYGFLFFYLVGFINQVFQDVTFSIKITLFGLHIFSGIGMYAFVYRLSKSRQAAFLAGLAYVLCFWHTQQVLILGRLHLSLFYALLPWPFYFFESLTKKQTVAIIGGGLTLGILPFVHPAYGFWATLLLGFYISLRFATQKKWQTKNLFLSTVGLFLLGIVFGAFLTLPMYLERAYAGLEGGVSYDVVAIPNWQSLFMWSNYQIYLWNTDNQNWYGGYMGVSLLLLTGTGIFGIIKQKNKSFVPIAICLIFTLILVFGYHWPIIRSIFIFQILASGRYLLFVTFFLSALVGITLCIFPRLQSPKIYASLLLFICIDLGATTFIQPYIPTEIEKRLTHLPPELYQSLQTETATYELDHLPPYRYLYLSDKQMMFLPNAWIPTQTGLPSCFNAYLEDPPATHIFNQPISNAIQDIVLQQKPFESLPAEQQEIFLAGLYALNVKHVFAYIKNGLAYSTNQTHSPILTSANIIGWENWKTLKGLNTNPQNDALTILQQMQINTQTGTCNRIFIKGNCPQEEQPVTPHLTLQDHRVQHQQVDLKISTSADGFIRLAYAYYPYLRIRINGEDVTPLETADRYIALKVTQGEHHITIEAFRSPLRRALLFLDLGILLISGIVLYRQYKS